MALVFGRNEVNVKRTSQAASVPNNEVARLMYYLSCVCTAIECNDNEDIRQYTNYSNWSRLSTDDQKVLLVLCYTFSPDVFEDKVFFHSEELCIQFSNEFYEINQVRQHIVAAESIIIAGRAHQVTKIMTYKMSWMRTNYLEPMQALARQLANPPARRPLPAPQRPRPAPVVDNDCCCTIM